MQALAAPFLLLMLLGFGLSACAPAPRVELPPVAGPPEGFPAELYEQAAQDGESVYRVAPEYSILVTYAYAEGALASTVGHSHVVSTRQIDGYVLVRESGVRADLYLAVEDLVVDDPELRAQAGFSGELSEENIQATRSNMLTQVLEAGRYPFVSLHLDSRPPRARGDPVTGLLTLHGQTREIKIPISVARTEEHLSAHGEFHITHTGFGMSPYSTFAGALRVSDGLDLRFDIFARRIEPGAPGR